MPNDFRVSPLHTTPGVLPKAGQVTDYLHENGDWSTLWIRVVGDKIEGHPGKIWVAGFVLHNGNKFKDATTLVANPIAFASDAWSYDIDAGYAKWCPCAPPFPDHCP